MTTAVLTPAPVTDLGALRTRLIGTVAEPGQPGYDLATPWNVAVAMTPRAVVAVADAQDVRETVRFAGDHGLRVMAQRTGHGAAALDGDDVLMIHTGALDEVRVDPERRCARVGAGAVWQQVIDAAAPHGLVGLAGSSLGVGVVGMVTGGGIGPLTRTYGLSSDSVRALEVVTGDGHLVRATPYEHADLFWGLRGGKGTLGVVCAVELGLLPAAELYAGALYFDGADAPAVLHAWRKWTQDLPEHVNTSVALLRLPQLPDVPPPLAGRATLAVRFTSVEDAATCEAILAPLRAVATPVLDSVRPMSPVALGSVHADPVEPMPVHDRTAMLSGLTTEAVDALLAVAGPDTASPQVIVEVRLLGGALARPGGAASAFCHRDAAYSLLTIGVLAPDIAAAVPAHAEQVTAALDPWATGGAMPNFASGTGRERARRCYDEDTRVWLAALADRHDPAGVLRVGPVVREG